MRALSSLFIGSVFVLLAVGFTWLGWQDYKTQSGLKERGTITTATIASFEGSFWTGRRAKVENFNYWVEYDGYRYHFQWRERYGAGERVRLIYDRAHPSAVRVLKDGETGFKGPAIDWRFSAMVLAFSLFGVYSIRRAYRSVIGVDQSD
jgi:hypothetical protein